MIPALREARWLHGLGARYVRELGDIPSSNGFVALARVG